MQWLQYVCWIGFVFPRFLKHQSDYDNDHADHGNSNQQGQKRKFLRCSSKEHDRNLMRAKMRGVPHVVVGCVFGEALVLAKSIVYVDYGGGSERNEVFWDSDVS